MAGSVGKIEICHDFGGSNGSAAALVPIEAFGVNTETYGSTVDEPGGILALGTAGADNDNAVLRFGPFKPADGVMEFEARFKYSNVDCAVFAGFTETLDTTTPVMPAEFATTTMTYNGTGGMVGIQYDVDGTTDDFRAVYADGGAAVGTLTRASATVTADRWFIARVVVYPDTSAEVWFSDVGHVATNGQPYLRLIKKFAAGLTASDLFFACLMIENRSATGRTLEVDYFKASGGRDWLPT